MIAKPKRFKGRAQLVRDLEDRLDRAVAAAESLPAGPDRAKHAEIAEAAAQRLKELTGH